MTGTNEGTSTTVADTTRAEEGKAILADMAEALKAYGNPDPAASHSTEARNEETTVAETPPAETTEKTPAVADDKAKAAPEKPHFDALPDDVRLTFEKLHRGETLTEEERQRIAIEVPKGYLRNADYTKKRMKEKAEAEELQTRLKTLIEENSSLIEATKRVLSTPEKHRKFLALASDEAAPTTDPTEGLDALEAKDRAAAIEKIATTAVDSKLTAKEQAAEAERTADERAYVTLESQVAEWRGLVKDDLSAAEQNQLLTAVEAKFTGKGVNILRVPTTEIVEVLQEATEKARLKKQVEDLTKQVTKRQSDAARSAKASSDPRARVVPEQSYDLRTAKGRADKALHDLGIEDWSQVPFGNRGPETVV